MKPLQRKKNYEVTHTPSGNEQISPITESEDVLSNEGSIDSSSYQHKIFRACGCEGSAGIGGCCYECGAMSCPSCHGSCHACHKPICLQHSKYLDIKDQQVRFCRRCYDQRKRQQKSQKIKRFFFSLVINYEE